LLACKDATAMEFSPLNAGMIELSKKESCCGKLTGTPGDACHPAKPGVRLAATMASASISSELRARTSLLSSTASC